MRSRPYSLSASASPGWESSERVHQPLYIVKRLPCPHHPLNFPTLPPSTSEQRGQIPFPRPTALLLCSRTLLPFLHSPRLVLAPSSVHRHTFVLRTDLPAHGLIQAASALRFPTTSTRPEKAFAVQETATLKRAGKPSTIPDGTSRPPHRIKTSSLRRRLRLPARQPIPPRLD